MAASPDIEDFERILEWQETVVLNITDNYPRSEHVVVMTCRYLSHLQDMRIEVHFKKAEKFLKDGMPGLAEAEFNNSTEMPQRIVFSQWFESPACMLRAKSGLHERIGALYSRYGFK